MGYIFSIYVSAGIIKSVYDQLSFLDPTIVTLILMSALLPIQIFASARAIRNVFNDNHFFVLSFLVGFLVLILLSAFYTYSPFFWKDKLTRVVLLTIPSFLIPYMFFDEKDIRNFLIGTFLIFSTLLSTLAMKFLQYGLGYFFLTNESGDPHYLIWGSYIAHNSLLFLGLLIFCHFDKRRYTKNLVIIILYILGSFLAAAILFVSGARGPTIFFSFLILVMCVSSGKKQILLFMGGLMLVLSLTMIALNISKENLVVGKSARLLNVNLQSTSIEGRIRLFQEAWEMISEKPFLGYGIGSFSYVTTGSDNRGYPHNIMLEIWSENGILALICFAIFLLLIFYLSYKRRHKKFVLPLFFVNLFFLFNLMKSSSLTDARIFFAYLGILYVMIYAGSKKVLGDIDINNIQCEVNH